MTGSRRHGSSFGNKRMFSGKVMELEEERDEGERGGGESEMEILRGRKM